MGPVVTRGQQAAAFDGIRRLASEAVIVCGGADAPELDGIDSEPIGVRGADLAEARKIPARPAPCTRSRCSGRRRPSCHIATRRRPSALVARGGGSLVASVYGEDQAFLARMVSAIGPSHGRLLMVDPSIASAHTGHGIVMPQCNHGGPGRAGAGEELGGLYGLRFYHQRLAVQGSSDLLAGLQATAASLH